MKGVFRNSGWSRRRPALQLAAVALSAILFTACSGSGPSQDEDDAGATVTPATTSVPVSVASVREENLNIIVTASGHTRALRLDRVRAPFSARLVELHVTDGDSVKKGQVVAVLVSKNSEAALQGARQMLRTAKSASDKADAERAVQLAQQNLVQQILTAPADGVVLSHAAEASDYIDVNEVLVTIAETAAIFFQADVTQSDVERVRPGQPANIDIPALGTQPITAIVQGMLPMASSENFSAPVRLNFKPARQDVPLGLFGSASIVVSRHENATVVPARAVLRDDVTGVTRVAIVESSGAAHWLTVTTGVREGDQVEIIKPEITSGTRVITDGQVGLPEGANIVVQK